MPPSSSMSPLAPEQGTGASRATGLASLLRQHLFSLYLLLTIPGMHKLAFELSYKSPTSIFCLPTKIQIPNPIAEQSQPHFQGESSKEDQFLKLVFPPPRCFPTQLPLPLPCRHWMAFSPEAALHCSWPVPVCFWSQAEHHTWQQPPCSHSCLQCLCSRAREWPFCSYSVLYKQLE